MERKSKILFAVVAACIALAMLPTSAFAISRDIVLDRGMVWVNFVQSVNAKTGVKTTGVLYSQSRWALENGSLIPTSTISASTKGYRTDCSGFASLCWNLRDSSGHPYSTTTADMGAKGSKKYIEISKAQLQPGDAILKSTAWGAPTGHVIIFEGWADAAQKTYWAMEQTSSSSHNGTIYHTRPYGQDYYRPYRYTGLEDAYADVEESVSAADAYRAAAAASASQYPAGAKAPTVPTVVIASAAQPGDQIVAASIAGGVRGPVLLVGSKNLPAVTSAEIKRLKPRQVILLGSTLTITPAVQSAITSLCPSVVRITGKNSYQVAPNALKTVIAASKTTTHPADTVYVANGDHYDEALTVAPLLSRASRPIVYVHAGSIPDIVLARLKPTGIKKIVILGGKKAVSSAVERKFRRLGYKISRVGDVDRYKSAVAIAKYAQKLNFGFTWKRVGITAPGACTDALAWATAHGALGAMYLLTPTKYLDARVRAAVIEHRAEVGKARVFGGSGVVSSATRKRLAIALRTGK